MHQIAQYILISSDFRIDLSKEDTQWFVFVQVCPVCREFQGANRSGEMIVEV